MTAAKNERGDARTRQRSKKSIRSLASSLDAILRNLNHGTDDGQLARTVGDLNFTQPTSAAIKRAGLGGIPTPRAIAQEGAGSAIIGVGDSVLLRKRRTQIADAIKRQRALPKPLADAIATAKSARRTKVDDLDPEVRRHILAAIKKRHNSIRGCYENWGLAQNLDSSGRLNLTFTLHPDGHLSDIHATVDRSSLALVAECVEEQVADWYLGAVLPDGPRRLSHPFILRPKR